MKTVVRYLKQSRRKLAGMFGLELDQNLIFMLLLLCCVKTLDKIVRKKLIIAPLLVVVPTYCLFSSIFAFMYDSHYQTSHILCTNTANTVLQKMEKMIALKCKRKFFLLFHL